MIERIIKKLRYIVNRILRLNLIETERLKLIPADSEMLLAEINDKAEFSKLIGAEVPADWPPEILRDALPYFAQMAAEYPKKSGWYAWYWISREPGDSKLVGSGGFKGPPDEIGTVEIGYSIVPDHQRRGYASEGAAALVKWAFSQKNVKKIFAETFADNYPSVRVLEKNGFRNCGVGSSDNLLRFESKKQEQHQPI